MMRDNVFALPCQEPTRCILRHKLRNQPLSASPKGSLFLSQRPRDWEEWLVITTTTTTADDNDSNDSIRIRSAKHGWNLAAFSAHDVRLVSDTDAITMTDAIQWSFETTPDEKHFYIISKQHQTMLSMRPDGSLYLTIEESHDCAAAFWSLEFLSGELCFLTHDSTDQSISSNIAGHLGMLQPQKKKKASAIWRFIEAGNGRGELLINSWSRPRFILCSDSNRRVFTTTNRQLEGTRWVVAKAGESVWIQSAKYGHLLAFDGKKLFASVADDVALEQGWKLDAAHSNIFHLHLPSQGKSLSCQSDDIVALDNASCQPERIIVGWCDKSGHYTIRLFESGKYVGTTITGQLALSTEAGGSELWDVSESPYGGVFLTSTMYQAELLVHEDGRLATERDCYEARASWVFQPAGLPDTVSDGKMLALVGAGVGAVALSVAMPFAVVGIGGLFVEAVAAEAIVAGVGGGLLLGGAVIGSTAAFVPNKNWRQGFAQSFLLRSNQNADNYLQENTTNRPLCAWESW